MKLFCIVHVSCCVVACLCNTWGYQVSTKGSSDPMGKDMVWLDVIVWGQGSSYHEPQVMSVSGWRSVYLCVISWWNHDKSRSDQTSHPRGPCLYHLPPRILHIVQRWVIQTDQSGSSFSLCVQNFVALKCENYLCFRSFFKNCYSAMLLSHFFLFLFYVNSDLRPRFLPNTIQYNPDGQLLWKCFCIVLPWKAFLFESDLL